jgi:hypothetical protein
MSNIDVHSLAGEALNAFWQVIIRRLPPARSGDLSPDSTVRLRLAAEAAVEEWIANNHASGLVTIGYRFRLIADVDRFQLPDELNRIHAFRAPAGMTGMVTSISPVILGKIDEHIPGAEHWQNQIFWGDAERFFQDTEPYP